MSSGIGYDSDAARAIGGALTAIMTGISYATSAEMAKELGPFPGYKKNREHMLRVIRNHRRAAYGENTGYEKLATAPVRLDHATLAKNAVRFGGLADHSRRAWDKALTLGEAAWLPQRAGDRGRADRHHRPRDGLRHHRHRARLRAGEVQEARRRRLLQDHQPRRARGAARARLQRKRDRRDRGLCGRPRLARPGARHQPHHLEGQGLHRRSDRQGREGAADRLRHQVRLQQVDARRRDAAQRSTFRPR